MAGERCGYFDNGLDTEHEHRANCRTCLLDRLVVLTAQIAQLVQRNQELEAQWGVMARACGNWREWCPRIDKTPTEWETKEYEAAARAILERDTLIEAVKTLVNAWQLQAHDMVTRSEWGSALLYKKAIELKEILRDEV